MSGGLQQVDQPADGQQPSCNSQMAWGFALGMHMQVAAAQQASRLAWYSYLG